MDALRSRRAYLLGALLIGLPTCVMAVPICLMGVLVGFGVLVEGSDLDPAGLLIGLWALGGLVGLLAWLWLSWLYLFRDRQRFEGASRLWWAGLAMGAVAAAAVAVVLLGSLSGWGSTDDVWMLFFGPLMLVPALHLIWLRTGSGRVPPVGASGS